MDTFRTTLQRSCGTEFSNVVATLMSIFRRASDSPLGHKHRLLRVSAPGFRAKVGRFEGAIDILKIGGFEDRGDTLEYTQPAGTASYVVTWLNSLDVTAQSASSSSSSSSAPGPQSFANALQRLRQGAFDEDSRNAVIFLMKVIRKAVTSPPGHKRRTIRLNNDVLQWRLGRLEGGLDTLASVGFVAEGDGVTITLPHPLTISSHAVIQCYNELLRHATDLSVPRDQLQPPLTALDIDRAASLSSSQQQSSSSFSFGSSSSSSSPFSFSSSSSSSTTTTTTSSSAPAAPFNPYQVAINRMEPQPRGSSISETEQQVEQLKKKRDLLLKAHGITKPLSDVERAFHAVQPGTPFNRQSIDANNASRRNGQGGKDALLTDTQLVVRSAKLRSAKAKQKEQMTTKAMRDLNKMKRQKLYAKTLLRVQFPSRLIVEGVFRPHETISDVCDVLRRVVLSEACAGSGFYLFTIPPKSVLDSKKTLKQLGLCPAALVYLGWSSGSAPASKEELLRLNMMAKTTAAGGSSVIMSPQLYPKALNSEELSVGNKVDQGERKNNNSSSTGGSKKKAKGGSKGKPSWLKL